ncbi:hypothetical protein [uncultured Flavobacterium sp.]|nr:hypothetical protein [uncultured Flavobacterium sp.]
MKMVTLFFTTILQKFRSEKEPNSATEAEWNEEEYEYDNEEEYPLFV